MSQFLFSAEPLNTLNPNGPFDFGQGLNQGSTDVSYSNRIRLSLQGRSRNEKLEEGNLVDLSSFIEVNDFVHTEGLFTGQGSNFGLKDKPFIENGTRVIAIEVTNGGTVAEITLSKAVVGTGEDEVLPGLGVYLFCAQKFFDVSRKGVISIDATKPQKVSSLVPLFSTDGFPLEDDFGNALVAESSIALVDRIQASVATLVNITAGTKPLKVAETFPTTSEVSSSILGVPRAEQQLSLFSDVSTLGLDEFTWEEFKTSITTIRPPVQAWEERKTSDSQRFNAKLIEDTKEQALALTAFPVPYTYPYDSTTTYYDASQYTKFYRFILLGNFLYEHYKNTSFRNDFLPAANVTVTDNAGVLKDSDTATDRAIQLRYPNQNDDDADTVVDAGSGQEAAYRLIDIWTDTFIKIRDGRYRNTSSSVIFNLLYSNEIFSPLIKLLDEPFLNVTNVFGIAAKVKDDEVFPIDKTQAMSRGLTDFYQPGYSWGTDAEETFVLQTKESYRYQPGRVSGFTFGSRADVVASSAGTKVEWGVHNKTDSYVFRLTGGNLSIVRKSTLPLSNKFLKDENLDGRQATIQNEKDDITGLIKPTYYELELNQTSWNVDPLNGNGPSGYQVNPKNVTMWKIEFSWYGAVGAKFYAYIPVGNGEARWVLLHTLVIENKLLTACLEDPFFRMKYSFTLRNRENSEKQQFVYKYGSSVYIDGGDDGTKKQFSYSGDKKNAINNTYVPLLAIKAKANLKNRDGIDIANRKIAYPESLNVSSSEFTKFQVVECEACPGYGYTYDNGLLADQPYNSTGKQINFHIKALGGGGGFTSSAETQYIKLSDSALELDSPLSDRVGFRPIDDDSQILIPGFGKRYVDYASTLADYIASDLVTKAEFLFDDDDLGPVSSSVIDLNTLATQPFTLNNSVGEDFDIEEDYLNLNFPDGIPVGTPIQIRLQIERTTNSSDDNKLKLVLRNSSDEATSAEVTDFAIDSPSPAGVFSTTVTLNATAANTTKIHLNIDGSPINDVFEITLLGAKVGEFRMSRVKRKEMRTEDDSEYDRNGIKTRTFYDKKFLTGSAGLRIGKITKDGAIVFDYSGIEDRVKAIIADENNSYNGTDALTETLLGAEPFSINDNIIVVNRAYFTGSTTNARKEYTHFIGNPAYLSSIKEMYAVSNIKIGAEDSEIRFLNPARRVSNTSTILTGQPTAEFRIAFTNVDPSNNLVPKESDLLFVDFDRYNIRRSRGGEQLTGPSDTNTRAVITETFQLDYRIKEIPSDTGTVNGGLCSKVKISAAERKNYEELSFYADYDAFTAENNAFNNFTAPGYTDPATLFALLVGKEELLVIEDQDFLDTAFGTDPNAKVLQIEFKDGEFGLNGLGSGINFETDPIYFQYLSGDGSVTHEACVVQLSAEPSPAIISDDKLTLSFVELKYTANGNGTFDRSQKKIFGFDPFPLHPIIFTRYGAQINNINFKKGNIVSSPSWTLYGNDISVYNPLATTDPGYIANADATKFKPENFTVQDSLSALLVDTSSDKRLRKIFTPGDSQFGAVFDNGRSAKTAGATSSKRVRTLTSFYSGGKGEATDQSATVTSFVYSLPGDAFNSTVDRTYSGGFSKVQGKFIWDAYDQGIIFVISWDGSKWIQTISAPLPGGTTNTVHTDDTEYPWLNLDGTVRPEYTSFGFSSFSEVLSTPFFTGPRFDTNKIDLTDVFGEDRFKVIQDIRDSKAIFIVGDQSNDDNPYIGTFQASVNTSEI